MKRGAIVSLFLSLLLLLSACGKSDDTGIIGGADGPTEIIVSKGGEPDGGGTPLTEEEMARYTDFLNEIDVYGFLLSAYDDVLDADLREVFYVGAGVDVEPTEAMQEAYSRDGGGDLTIVPAASLSAVLEKRTGHSMEDFLAHGNPIAYMLDEEGTFINLHGDTNQNTVVVRTGDRGENGLVWLTSEDNNPWEQADESANAYYTCVQDLGDGDIKIVSNQFIRGWRADYAYEAQDQTISITAETPPFDGYAWWIEEPGPEPALPVTLDLVSDTDNGGSDAGQWMADNWNEWMKDEDFAEVYGAYGEIVDADPYFLYRSEDGEYPGQGFSAWFREGEEALFSVDFTNFLFPPETEEAFRSPETALAVRWGRCLNGRLIVSSANAAGTYQTGYLTALDWSEGRVLWRSSPCLCDSQNFEVLGVFDGTWVEQGVILCGGSTGEGVYLNQVDLNTGVFLERTELPSQAQWLVHANGNLYVHCLDRDLVFDVTFG